MAAPPQDEPNLLSQIMDWIKPDNELAQTQDIETVTPEVAPETTTPHDPYLSALGTDISHGLDIGKRDDLLPDLDIEQCGEILKEYGVQETTPDVEIDIDNSPDIER